MLGERKVKELWRIAGKLVARSLSDFKLPPAA